MKYVGFDNSAVDDAHRYQLTGKYGGYKAADR